MRVFVKYFIAILVGQFLVLYIFEILGLRFMRQILYDPIFSFIARSLDMRMGVILIFLMMLLVFSLYAAVISGALNYFFKSKNSRQ